MKIFILLVLVIGTLADSRFQTPCYKKSNHVEVFEEWKTFFDVHYKSVEEEGNHFSTFLKNWEYISKWNSNPTANYTLGLNQFAAMTPQEFRLYIHGHSDSCLLPSKRRNKINKLSSKVSSNPSSVDWTTKGVVTPVKNQGSCGSCWAFSTTGSLESRSAIKTGKLVSLSEQQLVDCSGSYGNKGCQGGLMDDAFKYVKANGGLCSESEYPYKGVNGACKSSSCGTKYDPITGYTDVTTKSEPDLETAVVSGPVSIAIQANQLAFQLYFGGILTGACGVQLDHGVLVVGYDNNGEKYWKVKNSWGATWGEHGYVRLCKECNKNNGSGECGLLVEPSYPTV